MRRLGSARVIHSRDNLLGANGDRGEKKRATTLQSLKA